VLAGIFLAGRRLCAGLKQAESVEVYLSQQPGGSRPGGSGGQWRLAASCGGFLNMPAWLPSVTAFFFGGKRGSFSWKLLERGSEMSITRGALIARAGAHLRTLQ
jgi:hypothetical protein